MSAASVALRSRLATAPVIGTFCNIPDPASAEVLGMAGFEFVCLDNEHGNYDLASLANGIRAVEATGALPLVRVGENGVLISQVLDAGARGVIVPRVANAQDARAAVEWTRYPPEGNRGFGFGRNTRYGTQMTDDLSLANQDSYLVLQIESAAGLNNLEEICAVAGVDMICIGPYDLAVSTGEEIWSAEHVNQVARIVDYALSQGIATGIFCTSPETVARFVGRGVRLFIIEADVVLLSEAATTAFSRATALLNHHL